MSEKTFKIVNGDMSDGYHTFDELYDHRCLLFLTIVTSGDYCGDCYMVKDHFEGWDLVVWESHNGQISYHIPVKFREIYEPLIKEISGQDHKFDGHTSKEVVDRLTWNILESLRDAAEESD